MNQIKYTNRYSSSDKPDKMGRWARLANFNGATIAWISRVEIKGIVKFSVSCYFPTRNGAVPQEHKVCKDLEESKTFIQERWDWFTDEIIKNN